MSRHIAFLRAINVGGHTVKMDRLRQIFEEVGLGAVETFIASGNVIFDSPDQSGDMERALEVHLRQSLGYEVATFIRTPDELAAVARYRPFAEPRIAAAHALYIVFLRRAPDEAARGRLMALQDGLNEFHFHARELYWLCHASVHQSKVSGAAIEKALGSEATARNVTTVQKIAAKYAAMETN
jgi:uncharacterized protein (DUF1697 family)